jgi:uncharacterized membrane protein
METPPPLPPPQPVSSFPKQAATFSLFAPLAAFVIGVIVSPQMHGNRMAMLILGLVSTFLIIGGLILGIIALVATKRHGRAGIFRKALAGTIINGILVAFMVISIIGIMERTKAMQRQQMEQRQQ